MRSIKQRSCLILLAAAGLREQHYNMTAALPWQCFKLAMLWPVVLQSYHLSSSRVIFTFTVPRTKFSWLLHPYFSFYVLDHS